MKEELKIIQKDIEDLEKRLDILRKKEIALKEKIGPPNYLIGKYIKCTNHCYKYIIKVDSIFTKKNKLGSYYAEGPAIDINLSGNTYQLYSRHLMSVDYDDEFEFITKEEFEQTFEEAIKSFK